MPSLITLYLQNYFSRRKVRSCFCHLFTLHFYPPRKKAMPIFAALFISKQQKTEYPNETGIPFWKM